MNLVKISDVIIRDRQRKEITPADLLELKKSILGRGLLHPPVISLQPDGPVLVAGERRLKAISELHSEGQIIKFDGKDLPPFMLPFTTIAEMTPLALAEAELEENLIRLNLPWLELCEAKAKIHEMRKAINPGQTATATAKEIAAKQGIDPATITGSSTAAREVQQALLINKHKHDPAVAKAKSAAAAEKIILDKKEAAFRARLAALADTISHDHKLLKGDCREVMKTFPDNSFDIIFSDPPYGISADSAKKESKHYYDDSPDNALSIYEFIISEGFRVTKPKATLLLWCDIEHFIKLRTYAQQQGWTCWRTPLIYAKGETGFAPWGRAGYVRTYEILLYAVKGQKELYYPGGPDVKTRANIERDRQIKKTNQHAAEKPVLVLESYLQAIGLEGHTILDPCCGSGPIFIAGHRRHMSVTGIELDEHYYNVAASRLSTLSDPEEDGEETEPTNLPSIDF